LRARRRFPREKRFRRLFFVLPLALLVRFLVIGGLRVTGHGRFGRILCLAAFRDRLNGRLVGVDPLRLGEGGERALS
jgi:hypothetical protein